MLRFKFEKDVKIKKPFASNYEKNIKKAFKVFNKISNMTYIIKSSHKNYEKPLH